MSIADKIVWLQTAKNNIRSAIRNAGGYATPYTLRPASNLENEYSVYIYLNERVSVGDIISVHLNDYDTYRVSMQLRTNLDKVGSDSRVYNTDWRTEDIDYTVIDAYDNLYCNICIGRRDGAAITVQEAESALEVFSALDTIRNYHNYIDKFNTDKAIIKFKMRAGTSKYLVNNNTAESTDYDYFGVSTQKRGYLCVPINTETEFYTASITVGSNSPVKYAIMFSEAHPAQGSLLTTLYDSGWKTSEESLSLNNYVIAGAKYLIIAAAASSGSVYPTFSEFTENVTFEMNVSQRSYYIEHEYVGSNYVIPSYKLYGDNTLVGVILPPDIIFNNIIYCAASSRNLRFINWEVIKRLTNRMFSDCVSLSGTVNMPLLTQMDEGGTFQLSSVQEVLSLGTITSIPQQAFMSCKKLMTVLLPSTLTTIGYRAFDTCSSLERVVCDGIITTIGPRVFYSCGQLATIFDLSHITTLGDTSFTFCSSLKIDLNMPSLTSIGNDAFRSSGIVSITSLGTITEIPGNTTANATFANCQNLVSVVLPNTLTKIGAGVFYHCINLTTINIHTGLTIIQAQAFEDCYSLTIQDLNLPNLTEIGDKAFHGPKVIKVSDLGSITSLPDGNQAGSVFNATYSIPAYLEEIWLPATLTYIGAYNLRQQVNLENVVCLATTPPTLGTGALQENNATFKIYVPYSSDHSVLTAYQNATGWTAFASRMYELNQDGTIPV